ncbi:hypothetical protein HY413_03510 [Candidatus Kaiserbacteria bacterium]|nr:hypothetical protein [Candidatus Kaiserbacteria bacterium]
MDNKEKLLEERFAQLPDAVQKAITSADVEQHLRKLSDTNQLHLDQWQELETEVMMTLMGIKPVSTLQENIKKNVHVDDATAAKLSQNISEIVFNPIRHELDRFLAAEHAQAPVKEGETIQDLSADIEKGVAPTPMPNPAPAPTPTPAPPPAPPKPTVIRTEAPASYTPGQTSIARKDIHSDPYRIAPDA